MNFSIYMAVFLGLSGAVAAWLVWQDKRKMMDGMPVGAVPAAGPWREEEPDEEGRYLAELQGNPGTFEVLEYHDGRWLTKYSVIKNPSEVVLRYAEIHDPEVTV